MRRDELLSFYGGDRELMVDGLREYLLAQSRLLHAIGQSVASRDLGALEAAAHRLKGVAGYGGGRRVEALCLEIEGLAVRGDADAVAGAYERLAAAAAELRGALKTLITKAHPPS